MEIKYIFYYHGIRSFEGRKIRCHLCNLFKTDTDYYHGSVFCKNCKIKIRQGNYTAEEDNIIESEIKSCIVIELLEN